MTILASYEGFLMNHKDQPIMEGFLLLRSLAERNRIVLMTSGSRARVEHQLRTERLLDDIADIIDDSVEMKPLHLWERQIEVARASWPVTTIITANPTVSEYAVEHGIVSLFFAHPGFSKPAQRPVQGNRTWEELTQELDRRWSGV